MTIIKGLVKVLKPYPYQKKIVRQLAQMPKAILGAEMGTGKTLMSLLAMEANSLNKVLVLCPAIAVANWKREAQRVGFSAELRVMSYDKARQPKTLKELKEWGHQGIILDEAHFLKSSGAKRTRAVYGHACDGVDGLVTGCKRVYALSGTIAPNNVSELYPHLRFMVPSRVKGSYFAFRNRYCSIRDTRWGSVITGARNTEELKDMMRDVYIPLRSRDVLPDLPSISFNDTVVDPVDAKEALLKLKEYEKLPEIEALVQHLENAAETSPPPPSEHVATLRRLIGAAKTPAAAQYILEMLEGSKDKVVVFAYHKSVLRHLQKLILSKVKSVMVDGSCSQNERNESIHRFQNDPECRVFIGQLTACGTAITLTQSNQVVFLEQDWTPATNLQASKRCHRIGQERPVFCTNLMLHNSIDERISAALSAKTQHLLEIGLCPA